MQFNATETIADLTELQTRFDIRFPGPEETLDQDSEWCEVQFDGDWKRIRFHDYHEVFQIPGLYECLFHRTLRCNSPLRVIQQLEEQLREFNERPDDLRVLDVGAGNGMVGAALHNLGVKSCVGADIIPEARDAAYRDRPWAYDDYHVVDLTDMPAETRESLEAAQLNCLTTVAALGFGDIPPKAFLAALDVITTPAWLAFNVKEDFIHPRDSSGFAAMIQTLSREEVIQIQSMKRYRHRLSVNGEPLYYIAMVATKNRDVPKRLLA